LGKTKILRASEWPKTKIEYVYDGYVPRKTLSMVAGKRGDGKSLFAAWLAGQITTGASISPDGTATNGGKPGVVWYNTMEDAPDTIVRARLQAAGADLDRTKLSDWHLEIPDDAGKLRDVVRWEHPDLLILDSMQQHFRNLYHGFRENRRGMDLMFRVAKEANIGVLFVHHFNKGKHPSVEGAIGGQGIIQNMTKAIFVTGQHKATLGSNIRYLACERINASRPPSLSFELRTKTVPGYSEPIPYLEYTGVADVSSMDVFDASKVE
jgi:RecA-family ATPase